ncbi:MAG: thiamine pyrophosphate-dependent enzyme [Planctomycetota bacterium]|jgi:thiamine pyrophosphate-dependent acetolactate synthase large subunit-like protein
MHRAEAVAKVMEAVGDELVVCCNGMIGREAFTAKDRESNFYMIGSMGLALSIGLGVAMNRPDKKVLVLDGDGNVLMGAGVLASAAAAAPTNLLHVVLDNEAHGSTGDQRTVSGQVALEAMARAAGYRSAERVSPEDLTGRLPAFLGREGPAMLLVKVERGNVPGIARVSHTPPEITARFARSIQS